MLPVRDNIPAKQFPFITLLLIAANVTVFILEIMVPAESREAFLLANALVPSRDFVLPLSASGLNALAAWTLPFFRSMFMHAGLLHLAANLWTLWIFGDNVEDEFGHLRYLAFYILSGLAAALAHCWIDPHSTLPVVGASGAISGVMGAYLLAFPKARLKMFTLLIFYPIFFELPAVVFLVFWFFGQLLGTSAELASSAGHPDVGGVAFMAHIGGFVAGLVFYLGHRLRRGRAKR